jgi:hypothetical protein
MTAQQKPTKQNIPLYGTEYCKVSDETIQKFQETLYKNLPLYLKEMVLDNNENKKEKCQIEK